MATTRTGNRPYSGRPKTAGRQNAGEATFDAPTPAERRRIDEEQSRPFKESYEAGRKHGRDEGAKKGGQRKPSASRRRVPGAVSARTAARQLQAPVRAQITSGMRIAGITLGIVVLYDILTTPGPEAFSGVLGGLSKVLGWISAATPVPVKNR
jgi:hypothetical protein